VVAKKERSDFPYFIQEGCICRKIRGGILFRDFSLGVHLHCIGSLVAVCIND
jgi:hypothetical protein